MIVPLVDDEIWKDYFRAAPSFELPSGPVVVVVPHPDDETLGAGALIANLRERGVEVRIIAVTDGDSAYGGSEQERCRLGILREAEQMKALETLGVSESSVHRLRLPDSGLAEVERTLAEKISAIVEPDSTVLAPWSGDFHPDHEACARAAASVAEAKGLKLISYFFWTWHRGRPEVLDGLPLRRFEVSEELLSRKRRALEMHQSQLRHSSAEPILPKRLLAPVDWPFEVFCLHE